MEKIGLIVEGGGMKCAYSAGVLDVFLDLGFDKMFDYGIGVSAGAANLASFEAGQRDRNRRFYVSHSKDPRYISFSNLIKTGSLFGLQYIYGTLTNSDGGDPLDYDRMLANPMDMWLCATDAETGEVRYFNKKELVKDSYEPIMAGCCLPVACKAIEYQGHYYYDGGIRDSIPVEKALSDGCTKIVYVSSKPRDYVKKPEGFKLAYHLILGRRFPKLVKALDERYIYYNESLDIIRRLEAEGKCMRFSVPDNMKISTFTTDPQVMQGLYDAGVRDALAARGEVAAFLEK